MATVEPRAHADLRSGYVTNSNWGASVQIESTMKLHSFAKEGGERQLKESRCGTCR